MRRHARGVALIIALVVVALATVLATRIGAQSALDQRRGATMLAQQQAFEVAMGAEDWAMEVLLESHQRSPQVDSPEQPWATPLPPIPIDGGTVTGQLEDLQGRFNLNSLLKPDGGGKNLAAFAQFQRLLVRLELEPKWASLLLDWIDADHIADGVDGAEDGFYTGLTPPYRTADRPITSTSELLSLPGFGAQRYARLAPYVSALPASAVLNICTASGIVLDSLAPGMSAFSQDPKQLATNRAKGCFPAKSDLQALLQQLYTGPDGTALMTETLKLVDSKTGWFRATTVVSIGTTQLTLYSLLERNPGGYTRVVQRTLGTE
jgi:general secretion pathway protein K